MERVPHDQGSAAATHDLLALVCVAHRAHVQGVLHLSNEDGLDVLRGVGKFRILRPPPRKGLELYLERLGQIIIRCAEMAQFPGSGEVKPRTGDGAPAASSRVPLAVVRRVTHLMQHPPQAARQRSQSDLQPLRSPAFTSSGS